MRKIGRPKMKKEHKKENFVLTLSREEREKLQSRAAACGLSASAWVRAKLDQEDDGR